MLVEHLEGYFNTSEFAEVLTIGTSTASCIFDGGYAETLDAAGIAPSLFCIRSSVTGVAIGDTTVRGGVTYTIRNILPEPPDEVMVRLVLEKQ